MVVNPAVAEITRRGVQFALANLWEVELWFVLEVIVMLGHYHRRTTTTTAHICIILSGLSSSLSLSLQTPFFLLHYSGCVPYCGRLEKKIYIPPPRLTNLVKFISARREKSYFRFTIRSPETRSGFVQDFLKSTNGINFLRYFVKKTDLLM